MQLAFNAFLILALNFGVTTIGSGVMACPLKKGNDVQASSASGGGAENHAVQKSYPSEWWQEVPRAGVPEWEILPQDAGPGEVILSKRNELGILSNFTLAPFSLDGISYQSVEGFWQMMKFPESPTDPRATFAGLQWPVSRLAVSQMVAFEAKKAGDLGSANMKTMGINYVTFNGISLPYRVDERGEHFKLIQLAMTAKLDQNPEVKRILLATGDLVLKPDHKQLDVPPAWRYHEIWTELRRQLRGPVAHH